MVDLRALDARAVRHSVRLVETVTPADLSRRTPCSGWDLGALLAHMAGQHEGFAAAAEGRGDVEGVFAPLPPGPDPAGTYARSADHVLAAFAVDGFEDHPVRLPEIRPGVTFTGRDALAFHYLDYVVHSWDVARALGLPDDLPEDLVAPAVAIGRRIPAGPAREQPGAAFRPVLETVAAAPASPLAELLALTGRDPAWPA